MKRFVSAFVLVFAVASLAFAAPQMGDMAPQTVSGTIIDTACYAAGKHGPEDKGCTEMCLNMGVPASLLTDGGEVLVLLPPADAGEMDAFKSVKGHASSKVKVTGMVMERDGLKAMTVTKIEKG